MDAPQAALTGASLPALQISRLPMSSDATLSATTGAPSVSGGETTQALRYYGVQGGKLLNARLLDLAELWRYRELIGILVVRDLKVRYRQTAVGVAWALLQPLAMVAVFSIFFTLLGRKPVSDGVPYLATFLCGYLPWQMFAGTLTAASGSLVNHQNLISKVYFPRAVLPIAATLGGLVDFAIGLVLLIAVAAWHQIAPTGAVLLLPCFAGLAVLFSLALSLWFSALNALYRDIGYIIPFCLQVGFFVSPVVYESSALVPPRWQAIYALNPMAGVLDGFRWSLLGSNPPAIVPLAISTTALLLLFVGGLFYFRRVERVVADRI